MRCKMPTDKAERFSQIPLHNAELTGEELLIVTKQTVPKKTHNAKTSTLQKYHSEKARADNTSEIVSFGGGIIGTGKPEKPLQLDGDWLGSIFLKAPTNLTISSIGNRVTRYLPISRKSLYSHNHLDLSTLSKQPPAITVEATGELRVIAPGKQSTITVSYGRWSEDRNLQSEQLIERSIKPTTGLPLGNGINNLHLYQIHEIFGTTSTGTLALVKNISNGQMVICYYPLVDGSLAERAFGEGFLLTEATSTLGQSLLDGSSAIFRNSFGTYLMTLNNHGNASNPLDVEVFAVTLNDIDMTASLTKRNGWTISSYVGLSIGQPDLRLFDGFLGPSSSKVALVTDGLHTASLASPLGNKSQFITVLQDPNNIDDTTFYFRGYALLNRSGYQFKYNYDIGYKLTLTNTTASAVALASYMGSKPVLTVNSTINNQRRTVVNHPDSLYPEYLKILRDGSVVTGLVNELNGREPLRIHASVSGVLGTRDNDLQANLNSGKIGPAQVLDFKPGYGADISTPYKLYIASPIPYLLGNGGRGVIVPQILNLSGYAGNPTQLREIPNLPYVDDKYKGMQAYPVHLYLQHTGATSVLVASGSNIPEASNSTYIASVWFLDDGINSILTQQAFSRLHKHRQSYRPRGMSVPVAYDNAGQKPKQFWLTGETFASPSAGDFITLMLKDPDGRFIVPAGYRATIYMVGAGGGGGGSIHNYSSSWYNAPRDGNAGEPTLLSLSSNFTTNTIFCGGGSGGGGANWGNGSSFSNGWGGAGGTFNHNVVDTRLQVSATSEGIRPPIGSRWSPQIGGKSTLPDILPATLDGRGGGGAWGVGDEGWSYGGGGGSGAGATVRYTNNSSADATLYYQAGRRGLGRVLPTASTNGNPGGDGSFGFLMVELEKI